MAAKLVASAGQTMAEIMDQVLRVTDLVGEIDNASQEQTRGISQINEPAAELTALESGADVGASIRNPCYFCSSYGHKPTFGIVPVAGHNPSAS